MDREKRILLHENATLHEELCKAQVEVSLAELTATFGLFTIIIILNIITIKDLLGFH